MYERFYFNPSRARYKEIVNQTLIQTTEFIERFPEVIMYHSIYNQILDIKNKVIDNNMRFSDDEIRIHYSLEAIAVRNFNLEREEYAQRLSDIFGDAHVYPTLS